MFTQNKLLEFFFPKLLCDLFLDICKFLKPPRCSDFYGAEQSLSVSPPLWCRPCQLVASHHNYSIPFVSLTVEFRLFSRHFSHLFKELEKKQLIIFIKENWIHAHCSPPGLPPRLSNQVCAVGAKHDTYANHDCLKITMPLEYLTYSL